MRLLAFSVVCLPLAVACAEPAPPYPADLAPPIGPSWLAELGVSVDQTVLAHQGGGGRPPASARREPMPGWRADVTFHVDGGDLYRLLCRSCHGPNGRGAPPVILSALAGAAALSPELTMRRMKARGTPISEAMARQLARDAEKAVRKRLQKGGIKMPPFSYLRKAEANALLLYLEKRAGARVEVPRLKERSSRVGFLLVNGTCHLCHDATVADRTEQLGPYRVPTLAYLTYLPRPWVIAKVRRGLPYRRVRWGSGALSQSPDSARTTPAGMPAFPYLSAQEVAAAYDYLLWAPPVSHRPIHPRNTAQEEVSWNPGD